MADLLLTGASALLAFQRQLDTTSHNIANVSTDGYTRQRVQLQALPGQNFGNGFIGNGVTAVSVDRLQDPFILDRILESVSEQSRLDRFSTYADRLDTTLSNADTGLAQPMQNYFDALQGLSANPTSSAARNSVLAAARTLISRFQSVQGQLNASQDDVNARLQQAATQANTYTQQIAQLNKEISLAIGAGGGQQPNDLLDQRDQLLTQLSQEIGISVAPQNDGSVNVFTANGQALVVGFSANTLGTLPDPYQPQRLDLALNLGTGPVRITSQASGGEIGGLLDFRREVLDPASSELGRVAVSVGLAVNAQNAQGMDAYGALGGDLFNVPQPSALGSSLNTGSASLAVSFGSIGQLTGRDYQLRYDGANWSAVDATSGAAVTVTGTGAAGNPLVFGGVSIVVSGGAAAGDTFLVKPTAGAASSLGLAVTDPNRIATASPIRAAASLSNTGSGSITGKSVVDVTDPNLLVSSNIVFTSATTYSVDGGPAQAYTSGTPIVANGWSLTLNGAPATGDTFTVSANGAGSSDNGNANALGALSTAKLLDGGTQSLNGTYAGLVARIGGASQQADLQKTAQDAVQAQLVAQRDSVAGVNLDEEAANLVRFQQAYQAAAQVIVAANQMFASLLAAVRS